MLSSPYNATPIGVVGDVGDLSMVQVEWIGWYSMLQEYQLFCQEWEIPPLLQGAWCSPFISRYLPKWAREQIEISSVDAAD